MLVMITVVFSASILSSNPVCSPSGRATGRVFKNRIKIWYKKWCYIGVSKLLIFNTLVYKIVLCKFAQLAGF